MGTPDGWACGFDCTSAATLCWAGHLSGVVPPDMERALLVAFTSLSLVFAARKYTQAVKDDIGDKSVFECGPRVGQMGCGVSKRPLQVF